MRGRAWVWLALVAFVVAACASGASESSVVEGEAVTVNMFDNRFEYSEIRVPVGGSVTFVGAGRAPHNAVAADDAWSTESVFGSLEQYNGDSATLTFDQPGEYLFFCTFHGNAQGQGMAARLIVEG
ncbi:MAG: plastocyanin/azurin family copper-binding protein [Acidimicrobiia bacterium]